jgi:hypothetical protein
MNKKLITTMLALTGLAFSAQAKVGWTLEQARAHYGKEVKSEVAWCGGTAYGFIHDGLYVYAVISQGDTIGSVIYFDNKGKTLSDEKKAQLLRFNKAGYEFESGLTFGSQELTWNGEHNYRKLGREYFKHTVILRPSSFYGLVYNDIKPEKLVGFQVRSTSQFDFEQKSIK